jgi:RNA polymerase sigma-70 factor (ECF subfamily)
MEFDDYSDEQLVSAAQQGDMDAFSELVERYYPKLLRYGYRLLFNNSEVEDIVQEVFLKAYRNLQSFDVNRKFSPWIYRIAHNEFINYGKKISRQFVDFLDLEVLLPQLKSSVDLEKEYDRHQLSEMLDQAVHKLDVKYREPLVLYAYDQLSYQDISEILHIPISTVGVRIKRGRELLKLQITN